MSSGNIYTRGKYKMILFPKFRCIHMIIINEETYKKIIPINIGEAFTLFRFLL
jgi:hypothetical protein